MQTLSSALTIAYLSAMQYYLNPFANCLPKEASMTLFFFRNRNTSASTRPYWQSWNGIKAQRQPSRRPKRNNIHLLAVSTPVIFCWLGLTMIKKVRHISVWLRNSASASQIVKTKTDRRRRKAMSLYSRLLKNRNVKIWSNQNSSVFKYESTPEWNFVTLLSSWHL